MSGVSHSSTSMYINEVLNVEVFVFYITRRKHTDESNSQLLGFLHHLNRQHEKRASAPFRDSARTRKHRNTLCFSEAGIYQVHSSALLSVVTHENHTQCFFCGCVRWSSWLVLLRGMLGVLSRLHSQSSKLEEAGWTRA